jgi:hypothetical protein
MNRIQSRVLGGFVREGWEEWMNEARSWCVDGLKARGEAGGESRLKSFTL